MEQDHSSLTPQLPQAEGWNVCLAYFICFLFLKNQRCLLLFAQGLKATEPYILSRFIDVFNVHEVPSSRGSQVPSSMLGLEENSSKGLHLQWILTITRRSSDLTQNPDLHCSYFWSLPEFHRTYFWQRNPYLMVLWCDIVKNKWPISFITTSIFCRFPLLFPSHTQE